MTALLLTIYVLIFHPVKIADIPTTSWTHVCTTGVVDLVQKEADGDYHIRLRDGAHFIVAEIIPRIPLPRPKKGRLIRACGITREDKKHKHYELHPLLSWEAM